MPIYEYQCAQCGKVIEVYGQTIAQAGPPEVCQCGGSQTFSKLYSNFAAHGTGDHSHTGECCGGTMECAPTGGCCGGGHCHHAH